MSNLVPRGETEFVGVIWTTCCSRYARPSRSRLRVLDPWSASSCKTHEFSSVRAPTALWKRILRSGTGPTEPNPAAPRLCNTAALHADQIRSWRGRGQILSDAYSSHSGFGALCAQKATLAWRDNRSWRRVEWEWVQVVKKRCGDCEGRVLDPLRGLQRGSKIVVDRFTDGWGRQEGHQRRAPCEVRRVATAEQPDQAARQAPNKDTSSTMRSLPQA